MSRLVSVAGFRILDLLNAHRYMTLAQIRRYVAPDDRSRPGTGPTYEIVKALRRAGLVEGCPVEARGVNVYFLSPAGVLAVPRKRRREYVPTASAAGGMDHRHTWAVNEAGLAFVEAARQRADEFGELALEHEIKLRDTGTASSLVIADGVLQYVSVESERADTAILEVDRTTSPKVISNRLRAYAEISQSRGRNREVWKRALPDGWPTILFVVADEYRPRPRCGERYWAGDPALGVARCDRLVRYVGKAAEKEPRLRDLDVIFAPLPELIQSGPFAGIWRRPGRAEPLDWLGRPAMMVHEGGRKRA